MYSASAQTASGLRALGANEYAVIEQHLGQPTGVKHNVAVRLGDGTVISETTDQATTLQVVSGNDKTTNYVDANNPDVAVYATTTATDQTQKKTKQRKSKKICGGPGKNHVRCNASVITNDAGVPLASATPPASAYTPAQLHLAYRLPCTSGGAVATTCTTPVAFGGQMIAIVDAYNDPTVEQDLAVFSNQYNLPPCTKANGCLTVVNQTGGSALPATDAGWALEISLDVQTAHALCQTCRILLVESNTNSWNDIVQVENQAAAMGATEISNSYGSVEWSGEGSFDAYYNHPGIAILLQLQQQHQLSLRPLLPHQRAH